MLDHCLQACSGRKGIVYDYFNQYCPSVTLTNSDWWTNFNAGYDSACTGNTVTVYGGPVKFLHIALHLQHLQVLKQRQNVGTCPHCGGSNEYAYAPCITCTQIDSLLWK